MKILVLGCNGMLGHQFAKYFTAKYEVYGLLHHQYIGSNIEDIINENNVVQNIDLTDFNRMEAILNDIRPDIILNAVGVIKQRDVKTSPVKYIEINSLLPHKIAILAAKINSKFIHMSTDCVFSGKKGQYLQTDLVDAEDIYGKTKYLGEVSYSNCITLRTSIIGLELNYKKSLIEWFLSQKGCVNGYSNAIFSGFTTIEMARIIERVLLHYPNLSGVYHVASNPISKYELLTKLSEKLNRSDVKINPYDEFACDRSLIANEFNSITSYVPPDWDAMLSELAEQIKQRGDIF